MALVTDAQLANQLHLSSVDPTFAERARSLATSYLRVELGVEFGRAERTLTKRVPVSLTQVRLPGPLVSVSTVTVDESDLAELTDWEATATGVACPRGFGQYVTNGATWCDLEVTYTAGFTTTPPELADWATYLAGVAYTRLANPGVRSISVDGVSESYADDASTPSGVALDESILRGLRARYGSGRRLTGSVLVR